MPGGGRTETNARVIVRLEHRHVCTHNRGYGSLLKYVWNSSMSTRIENWRPDARELRREIRMDLCGSFPPLPQLRAVFEGDADETSTKDPWRLFQRYLRGIFCQRLCLAAAPSCSGISRRVYSSVRISPLRRYGSLLRGYNYTFFVPKPTGRRTWPKDFQG